MMLSADTIDLSVRIATVVVPISVYFLLLGFLNSRSHPQLLTARQDFALLMGALCPLFVLPVVDYLPGGSLTYVVAVVGLVALGVKLLAPGGHGWVIYNISLPDAHRALRRSLQKMGHEPARTPRGLDLGEGGALEVSAFPMLQNVSVKLTEGDAATARQLEETLHQQLCREPAETPPTAVAMILAATAMLVAPLALFASNGAVEIVRVLTDLLK